MADLMVVPKRGIGYNLPDKAYIKHDKRSNTTYTVVVWANGFVSTSIKSGKSDIEQTILYSKAKEVEGNEPYI